MRKNEQSTVVYTDFTHVETNFNHIALDKIKQFGFEILSSPHSLHVFKYYMKNQEFITALICIGMFLFTHGK